jgi:hypothetical protein
LCATRALPPTSVGGVLVVASIILDWATVAGGLAGSIAVMGFVFQAARLLEEPDEQKVRQATVVGGLAGLSIGLSVILLSATL